MLGRHIRPKHQKDAHIGIQMHKDSGYLQELLVFFRIQETYNARNRNKRGNNTGMQTMGRTRARSRNGEAQDRGSKYAQN